MARTKREDTTLVTFGSWQELLNAVHYDYNVTTKEICETLRCSEAFVRQCIRPWLRHTYVSDVKIAITDEGDELQSRAASHLRRLYGELNSPDKVVLREDGCTVLFSRKDYMEWIKQHTTVSARTKRVDITKWLKDSEEAVAAVGRLRDAAIDNSEVMRDYRDARNYHLDAAGQAVLAARVPSSKSPRQVYRKVVNHAAADAPWIVVEDAVQVDFSTCKRLKEFGIADAAAYRIINQQGWLRVDLTLPDSNGVLHTLTYYMPDPAIDALPDNDLCGDCFAVLYEVYLAHLPGRSQGAFVEWDKQREQRRDAERARAEEERRRREQRRRDSRQRAQGIPPRHGQPKGRRDDRDKAIDQCCAMWRMVNDPAAHASDGERASAKRGLERLMAKHGITEDEIRAGVARGERRR